MRIVYVITRADEIGGAQIHVRDLAIAVRAAGHEVTVLSGTPGPLSEELTAQGVAFRPVPDLVREISPRRDLAGLRQLSTQVKELQADLVTTHSSKAGWLGRLAARRCGVPGIFTAHGWAFTEGVPWPRRRLYALAERLAAPLGDHIITVSEYDRALALARRIAPAARITCIHNGVHDVMPESRERRPGPVRLLMLGRFSAQKDHGTLLRALAGVGKHDWVLDLAGEGDGQAEIEALAARLGIAARVHVLGHRRDVDELLRRSDVFALISNWEGLPYSVLEAMSAALPVVASDVGGVREAVAAGETGILVPRGDVAALQAALAKLLGDPAHRLALGAAGRRRYESAFRFEHMLGATRALYERVVAARPVAASAARSRPRS
jgi:glycosyltransferase involved in cell wall biosynthesis